LVIPKNNFLGIRHSKEETSYWETDPIEFRNYMNGSSALGPLLIIWVIKAKFYKKQVRILMREEDSV
jgi:hypothetical protein